MCKLKYHKYQKSLLANSEAHTNVCFNISCSWQLRESHTSQKAEDAAIYKSDCQIVCKICFSCPMATFSTP